MLRIRLLRVGKKNSPSFRLVVTPRRTAAKTGKFLEILGFYNPLQHTKDFKKERIQYWLSMGAQPSDTVHNLLVKEGMSEGAKIAVHKKAKAKEEEPAASPLEADKQASPPASPVSTDEGEAPEKAAEEGGASTVPVSEPATEDTEKKEDSSGESEEAEAVEEKKA